MKLYVLVLDSGDELFHVFRAFKKKMLFNMLHRVRNAPHPHLLVSSGRRSWRPVPPWTLRLWAALPAGQAGPPGSLCSHRRHGCSPISSPSSSPSPCVRKEASFRCCWGHFVVAGRWKRTTFNDEPSCDVCCFVEIWVLDKTLNLESKFNDLKLTCMLF